MVEVFMCDGAVAAAEEDTSVEAAVAAEEEINVERHRRQQRRPV
jgi:hypothetical protein